MYNNKLSELLVKAILTEDLNTLDQLTRYGAERIQIHDEDSFLLLRLAIQKENHKILEMLTHRFPIDQFIIGLCENDEIIYMKYCVENNAYFKYKLFDCTSAALRICAKFNSVKICKYLIGHDAGTNNVNESVETETTALHVACKYRNIEIVKLLCDCTSFNINKLNILKESALHILAKDNKNLDIIKILLNAASIDVNLMDIRRCTALAYACSVNAHDIVKQITLQKLYRNINLNENHIYIRSYKLDYPDAFKPGLEN